MVPGKRFSIDALVRPYGYSAEDFYVFVAAMLAFLTVMIVGRSIIQRDNFASRAKLLQERHKALQDGLKAPKRRRRSGQNKEAVNFMRQVVTRLQLIKKNQVQDIVAFLTSAGIRSKDAIFIYTFFQLVLPFVFLVIGLFFVNLDFSNTSAIGTLLFPIGGAYMGLKLPTYVVARKRKKRYLRIQQSLADTLDLMMICSEAGLSLSQSLDRVAKELRNAYPEMADELGMTSLDMNFQPDRHKALTGFAERVKLPEVKGIVNVLVQTEKYGTPISQALRTLSAEFRTARMLRAEQKAARLPAIMTIPMIIFILPTLFIVVIAPAAISLMGQMK